MKKFLILLTILTLFPLLSAAQEDSVTVDSGKTGLINDYSMIGVNYGVTFSNMYFSPSKHNRLYVFAPNYVSVMYTKHCKMFDILPLFAFSAGVAMGNEGFAFEADKETGEINDVDGATWCSIKVRSRSWPTRESTVDGGRASQGQAPTWTPSGAIHSDPTRTR